MGYKPWVSGPKELLDHGLEHLRRPTDFDARIAIISIDNAVELAIKVYLALPKRITGVTLSKQDYDKMIGSFPSLLDALRQYAPTKIVDIELDHIEFYHRLRNALYHQGNGITIERQKVEDYADAAKTLMYNLFEIPREGWSSNKPEPSAKTMYQFLSEWQYLIDICWRFYLDKVALSSGHEGTHQEKVEETYLILDELCSREKILPDSVCQDFAAIEKFQGSLSNSHIPSAEEFEHYQHKLDDLYETIETALYEPIEKHE